MTTATEERLLSRTLLGALACLDVDLAQEIQRWREERDRWGPDFWNRWLAEHPTPPPDTAWAFPPAASAEPPSPPTETPDMGTDNLAIEPSALSLPDLSPADAVAPDAETSETPDFVADSLPTGATTELPTRPSWSERLNRIFARRQAQGELGTTDPWAESFPEPLYQRRRARGLQQPVLGFAIGVTVATLGTLGVLLAVQRRQPPQPASPTLSVPAPPPESAVLPSPVPNLARKELPDLSTAPTASPSAKPNTPTNPGLFYVVMDYQNEQSLLQAQKVVPEAFIWQFDIGLKVQLGAFETRDQAEAFVADLKAKGLQAQVYP
ncbi:MAG: SPOR domain-containing protein [Gloeomargarita sp. SKYG116]|nr:SPOR domain-containing protein [Gloeomargarita sp. SKYG116]MCS7226643.1 SPOR domain-containing protein [Gloeomargarita sp. SKYB31]MDW8400986.1 SPOR domain-containing protein [Gloeomargarita sp. SKYGB_i_bin116]